MQDRDGNFNKLKLAEHQFRLACTVSLAVANSTQTLDVPVEWTFGSHRVHYQDFGLRQDQAAFAASQLELTATLALVSTIRDVIVAMFDNPKVHPNGDVVVAYQVSRLLRNAFAHSMVRPQWSIDSDCRDRAFKIDGIISLNTGGLHGQPLDWRHYGGPSAIFKFGRFVRESLLNNAVDPCRVKPAPPTVVCYQQGRVIFRRVEEDETR